MSREVLAPTLQVMSHNRNYRVNNSASDEKWRVSKKQTGQGTEGYIEPDLYAEDDGEDDVALSNIQHLPDGSFKLALHVPKALYGGIVGLKGSSKRRIETETKTDIYVPRATEKSSDLIIKSKERTHVCQALRRLRLLIDSLRSKTRPTHFLGAALNFGMVQEQFVKFKETILEDQIGIDSELFVEAQRLHLTLGVYALLDDDERKTIVDKLGECRQFLADLTTPFEIEIKGLEIMNDDPSMTRILFAHVEAPELQKFADKCLKHFQPTGLCANDNHDRESIKLHMTLLSNRKRKSANPQAPNGFDAREVLKRYGDYNFGKAQCNEVHICVMNANDDLNTFYKTSGSLNFET